MSRFALRDSSVIHITSKIVGSVWKQFRSGKRTSEDEIVRGSASVTPKVVRLTKTWC
jgi:hypothetical protein